MTELSTDTSMFDGEGAQDSSKPDLSLFEPTPTSVMEVNTASSDKNLMAQAALIDGEDLVGTYQALSTMPMEERSVMMKDITDRAKLSSTQSNMDFLGIMLQDPTMSPEDKEIMVRTVAGEKDIPYDSMIGAAEAIHTMTSGETTEREERRLGTVAELIAPAVEHLKVLQQVTSSLSYNDDGSAVGLRNNYGDLTELVLPLNEQAFAIQVSNTIDPDSHSLVEDFMTLALLGEGSVNMIDNYDNLSLEDQTKWVKSASTFINNAKTINLLNDNQLLKLDTFMKITKDGYYTTTDRVLDNIGSVLDVIPIVNLLYRATIKPISKAAKLKLLNTISKTSLRGKAATKQPGSVSSLAEQVNPEVARNMAADIAADTSGEAADVMAGTTRTEAMMEAHGPQVNVEDGSVVAKPYALDRRIEAAAYGETSKIYRTPAEIKNTMEVIREGLKEVNGLVNYKGGATSHKVEDNGSVTISERYITPEGGFHSPEEAIAHAMRSLEHYGVKESDITIMQKQGGEYVNTTVSDVQGKKLTRETLVGGGQQKSVDKEAVKKQFLLELRERLLPEVSSRLSRGDRSSLTAERQDLAYKLGQVTDEVTTTPSKKGVNARKAKKEEKKLPEKDRELLRERIALIDSKLKASKAGEVAEANLSRVEQGIIPDEFSAEFVELTKVSPTKTTTKKALPDELKKVNMQDDFAVKVDWNYDPRAVEIVRDDLNFGKLNYLDTLSSKVPKEGGTTVSKWLFQASALLPQVVNKGSVAAVDQGNRLQKSIMDLANDGVFKPLEGLEPASAERLIEIFKDQNLARKEYSKLELSHIGVVDEAELQILDNWKYVNDQLFQLTNRDMAKSLKERNYSMFTDTESGDVLIGRVMSPTANLANRPRVVYNPLTKQEEILTPQAWASLHESGGQVFELKSPDIFDVKTKDGVAETEFTHIIKTGSDSSRYTKSIQETDRVLNYSPGHYHISYANDIFIDRVMRGKDGKVIESSRQAILTAEESTSATMAAERLAENATDAGKGRTWEYSVRDAKELDPVAASLRKYEVAASAGMSAQRRRGKTLQNFDSRNVEDMAPKIADPLESFKASAAELAKRVPMRDYLDDLEARILAMDKKGIHLPKDEFGNVRMPNSGDKLKGGDVLGSEGNKKMADIRTMVEHYNFLKYGYLNNIDKHYKSSINLIGKTVGKVSRRLEKSVTTFGKDVPSIVGALKGTVFNAHIAFSSPPSQWMVQGLPTLMNALINPKYVLNPTGNGMLGDMRKLVVAITKEGDISALEKSMGKEKAAEIAKLKEEWDRTGLGVGVDKHLLVENSLEGMMDTGSNLSKVGKGINAVSDTGRKVGFDVGETFYLMGTWLSTRNDAIKAGKNMDNARDFEEVRARTRSLTMNMNKAGEQPWNKNSLSLWTQFMISPYKAITMLLDKSLTTKDRIAIGAWQSLIMPLPSWVTYNIRAAVGVEGTEGDLQTELITNGLLGGLFNSAVSGVFEDAGSISWQRNVQVDPEFAGPFSLIHHLTDDLAGVSAIQSVFQASPSLSALYGYNPIVTNLFQTFGKVVAAPVMEDDQALLAMKAFAGENGALWQYSAVGRGFSSAWKEIFSDTAGTRYSALSGKQQVENVSAYQSIMRALTGQETTSQTVDRATKIRLYDGSKEARADADLLLEIAGKEATALSLYQGTSDRALYIMEAYANSFPDGIVPPKQAAYLLKSIKPKSDLMKQIMTTYQYGGKEEAITALRALGTGNPEVESMLEFMENMGGEE